MNAPTSTRELLDLVRKSGIHSGSELDENLKTITKLPNNPSQTAALFVKNGMLTRFQAKLLLNGKYRGFRLGSYVVQEQLGQGGMGTVYLAQHETLKRQVALKVLPPPKNDPYGKLTIERFLREARAAAALDHPNIVRIHDVGQQGEVHFLVMEYVDGQTLDDMLTNSGAISPSRAVDYIAQAAAGLQHAHEKGFIHRDIKPANLIVTKDGTLKILDMGLARSTSNDDKLTERLDEGAIVGTADFISPEQAMNNPNIDIRTDIYSLGATFFSLVTGKPPFDGNTTQKLVQHQMKAAPSLTEIDRTFPAELAKVVAKMLDKKPEKRYQTPGEVITALAEWLPNAGAQRMVVSLSGTGLAHDVEMQATLSEMAHAGTKRLPRITSSKPFPKLYAALGVGAIVLLAVGLVTWMTLLNGSDGARSSASVRTPGEVTATQPKTETVGGTEEGVKPTRAPKPSKESRNAIFALDLASIPPFRMTKQGEERISGEPEKLPNGVFMTCWKSETLGEFSCELNEDTPVLKITNVQGPTSAQIAFEADRTDGATLGLPLVPFREYKLIVEYRTTGRAHGQMYFQRPYKKNDTAPRDLANLPLPNSNTEWRQVELKVTHPNEPVRFLIETHVAGKVDSIMVRRVELHDVPVTPSATPTGTQVRPGKVIQLFDPATLKDSRVRLQNKLVTEGKLPVMPKGWEYQVYNSKALGEFLVGEHAGKRCLAIGNRDGKTSSQLIFRSALAGRTLLAGRTYQISVEYRNDPGATAMCTTQLADDFKVLHSEELKAERWTEHTFQIVAHDGNGMQLTFGPSITDPEKYLYIGRIEIREVDAPRTNPISEPLLKLNLGDLKPFQQSLTTEYDPDFPMDRRKKRTKVLSKTGDGDLPTGWYVRPFLPGDQMKVIGHLVEGVPTLTFQNENDRTPNMVFSPMIDTTHDRVRVRLQYKLTGDTKKPSTIRLSQLLPTFKDAWDWVRLEPTNGEWVMLDRELDLKGATQFRLELHHNAVGRSNSLSIQAWEILPPESSTPEVKSSTAPPKTLGTQLYALDLSKTTDFRYTVENMKPTTDPWTVLPPGLQGLCWDKDAIAEFRSEVVLGKRGFGATNLNAAGSCQIHGDFEQFCPNQIQGGKTYRLQVTYLTKNDSLAKLHVRKPKEDWQSIAQIDLANTNGAWKTAVVDFVAPPNTPLDMIATNKSVGEGNIFYVSEITLHELTDDQGR